MSRYPFLESVHFVSQQHGAWNHSGALHHATRFRPISFRSVTWLKALLSGPQLVSGSLQTVASLVSYRPAPTRFLVSQRFAPIRFLTSSHHTPLHYDTCVDAIHCMTCIQSVPFRDGSCF